MNKKNTKKIIQNILSLFFGRSFILIINFLSITLAARFLGVENFGNFSYLLAITSIVSKFVDLGQSPIVLREISKETSNDYLINTSFSIRIVSFVIYSIIFNLTILILSFSELEILLSNLFLLNIFISSKYLNFRELLDLPFKRALKMRIPIIVAVIDNLLFLASVLIMINNNYGFIFFCVSYVLANLPGFIIMLFLFSKESRKKISFNFRNTRWLLGESAPLFIFVICVNLYQQLEIILLTFIDSKYSAGIYSVAVRLTAPLSIVPAALVTTLFPIIVSSLKEDMAKVHKIVKLSFKILFLISFLLATYFTFKGEFIIQLVFGKAYIEAVLPTIILLWAQIFLFYNFFALDLFTAFGKQKNNSIYAVILLIVHVILLVILIPIFSNVGASIAKIVSSIVGSIFIFIFIKKILTNSNFIQLRLVFWSFFVFLTMFLLSTYNFFLFSIIGVIISISSLFLFRIFDEDEMAFLKKIYISS